MLSAEQKKQAIRDYKERKPAVGIYAIRCAFTDRAWVGPARNLDAARNAAWFALRTGAHRDAALQAEWNVHGETAFAFEVLEKLPEDTPAITIPDLLKDRKQHWMAELRAPGLL
jgi:hypothetical protein